VLIASVPVAMSAIASRTSERGLQIEPLWRVLTTMAAFWYPWAILAPFVDRRVRRSRAVTRIDRARGVAGHAMLFLAFLAVHSTITRTVSAAIYPEEPQRSFLRAIRGDLIPEALLYAAIAAGFTIAESRRRHTEVAERLRAEVAEARLDALRQQLNPHFLFNTLNHIVSQLRTGEVASAEKMLLSLGDLLRDVLRERAQLIPLRDEVRMIERYLEIERQRFGDRLQAEVTFEPRALDALVPSLILQPLVENAMRHGVSAADGRCRLALAARVRGERLSIEVRDAGPGIDPESGAASTGVGLTNTSQRLRYLYGDDHTFDLRTVDGGGLVVSIDLPLRRA
jgi:two-component system LytT family sensor kinase